MTVCAHDARISAPLTQESQLSRELPMRTTLWVPDIADDGVTLSGGRVLRKVWRRHDGTYALETNLGDLAIWDITRQRYSSRNLSPEQLEEMGYWLLSDPPYDELLEYDTGP